MGVGMWEGCRCPEGDLSGDLYSNANGLRRERERGGRGERKAGTLFDDSDSESVAYQIPTLTFAPNILSG